MTEIFLIALYLFIVGFEIDSMGLLEEDRLFTTGDKILATLFCMTVDAVTFPLTLGVKISKFLDRK